MAQATNVTKYNAPGGDNIIPDGYINTVEKVWLDSYTLSDTTSTNTTIDIAVLPQNKKITGIDVFILSTTSQTNGTISIGFSTDSGIASIMAAATVTHNLTVTSISLPSQGAFDAAAAVAMPITFKNAGYQGVTGGTATTISVKLNNWTMTNGTLKSVVRWT